MPLARIREGGNSQELSLPRLKSNDFLFVLLRVTCPRTSCPVFFAGWGFVVKNPFSFTRV
jgi:hypothetical protein